MSYEQNRIVHLTSEDVEALRDAFSSKLDWSAIGHAVGSVARQVHGKWELGKRSSLAVPFEHELRVPLLNDAISEMEEAIPALTREERCRVNYAFDTLVWVMLGGYDLPGDQRVPPAWPCQDVLEADVGGRARRAQGRVAESVLRQSLFYAKAAEKEWEKGGDPDRLLHESARLLSLVRYYRPDPARYNDVHKHVLSIARRISR